MNLYKEMANSLISKDLIPKKAIERVSEKVIDLMKGDYVVDVHTHFFDMHCINSGYFVLRMVKDLLRMRGDQDVESEQKVIEDIYKTSHVYTDGWNDRLKNELGLDVAKRGGIRGVIFELLWKTKMIDVYKYYLKDSSLATYFGLDKKKVLTTVLMMDFYKGWGVKTKKSILDQIIEMKKMQKKHPVLPFLFCDPRRADETINSENLYVLFDLAFSGKHPFFGVKIYPSLGYDPSDYRLWPIYEICNEFGIPVLTHCGGVSVSTNSNKLEIFEGDKQVILNEKTRKDVGTRLNDPNRWALVLEKYPKLKLNFAHFGSNGTWVDNEKVSDIERSQNRKDTIIRFMKSYENVYSDFSYTITHEKASRKFKEAINSNALIADRSMFGSDYWVVSKAGQLADNQKKFLDLIKGKDDVKDNELIKKLTYTNPLKYLFGDLEENNNI